MIKPKPCIVCGHIFTPRTRHTKICSKKCREERQALHQEEYRTQARGLRELHDITCRGCGSVFSTYDPRRQYCSPECHTNRIKGYQNGYYMRATKLKRQAVVDAKPSCQCVVCGTDFHSVGGRKTCSAKCKHKRLVQQQKKYRDRRTREAKKLRARMATCQECGLIFPTCDNKRKFCTPECRTKSTSKRHRYINV